MISLWSVILNAVLMGLFFGVVNFIIITILNKKSEKAFEEHMKNVDKHIEHTRRMENL